MAKDLIRTCTQIAVIITHTYGEALDKHFDKYTLPSLITDLTTEVFKNIENRLHILVPAEFHSLVIVEAKKVLWETKHIQV